MDRVKSILISAIVDVVAFCRVRDRIKPLPRNTTNKCSEHNPRIGSLTDLHTRRLTSYFSSTKRSSYKNQNKMKALCRFFFNTVRVYRSQYYNNLIFCLLNSLVIYCLKPTCAPGKSIYHLFTIFRQQLKCSIPQCNPRALIEFEKKKSIVLDCAPVNLANNWVNEGQHYYALLAKRAGIHFR